MKKLKIPNEIAYVLAIIILALAVCFATASDFGVSMIVAPSYILSMKFTFLTFGQWEYVTQALLFVIFCIMMKRFHWTYLSSFITCVLYGCVLDLWRLIPLFDPNVTIPGSMNIYLRVLFFLLGMFLCSFSIAIFNKTYIYPEVVDMFPRGAAKRFNCKFFVAKYIFDATYLIIGLVLSLCFFKGIRGIGWGTLVLVVCNSFIINLFMKMLDKFVEFPPVHTKFAQHFDF